MTAVGPAKPVIVDCDPGVDDAFALALACSSPGLDIRAVTTVCGNAEVAATTRNALALLALFGHASVPVASGAATPRERAVTIDPAVHGSTGLGHVELPPPAAARDERSAVDLMASVVETSPDPVTLIATGPLTNVAAFVETYPDLAARLERVALMGGALGAGNVTPVAEFNVWFDPHAAALVFAAPIPILMAGLDVTQLAVVDQVRALPGDSFAASALRDMYAVYADFYVSAYGRVEAPLHDAVPVCALVHPEAMETVPCSITVVTDGPLAGRTVPLLGSRSRTGNVSAIVDMDTAVFQRAVQAALTDLST